MYWKFNNLKHKFIPEIQNNKTIKVSVEKTAEVFKDKTYLIYAPTGEEFSFEQSNIIANQYAHALTNLGLKKGDRIGLYLTNRPEYVFLLFAVAKLGLIQVPINPNSQAKEINYMLNLADINVVITESTIVNSGVLNTVEQTTEQLKQVISIDLIKDDHKFEKIETYSFVDLVKNVPKTNPNTEINEDDSFSIMFTSGTTGPPKGAITSQKTALLASFLMGMTHNEMYRNYTCLPLFHANAQLYSCMGMRSLGGTVILDSGFSATNFFNQINKYNATSFNSLGGMMQILDTLYTDENIPDITATEAFVAGVSKEVWESVETKFNINIYEGYGMTEFPVGFFNAHPEKSMRKIGSCGKPSFTDLGLKVKLVDEENKEITVGTGQLLIKGDDFVTKGYWDNKKATMEAFENGWFKTGDILRVDEDGYYYFVDRDKFMIRTGGENVSTFEIEETVNRFPLVKQSAAIPIKDKFKGEEIKILLTLKEDKEIQFNELVKFCLQNLAYHKVPRYYEIIDEFPKTPTERIQKNELEKLEDSKTDHGWDRNKEMPNWRDFALKH